MGIQRQSFIFCMAVTGVSCYLKIPFEFTIVVLAVICMFAFAIQDLQTVNRKGEFHTQIQRVQTLASNPEQARFVGMRTSPLWPVGPGFGLPRITLSPPVYIQRVMQTIKDAIPNKNRHLARIIAEYALSVHIVYVCKDVEAVGILYYGLDETMADDYVQPSALPVDKHHVFLPVYWDTADEQFKRTRWYEANKRASQHYPSQEWLLHIEGTIRPALFD